MGASVLVNGFMMPVSIDYLIDFQFRRIMRSDVDLTFKDERGQDALREAAKLPGVDRAEPVLERRLHVHQRPAPQEGVDHRPAARAPR